jgi:hypothetical protein
VKQSLLFTGLTILSFSAPTRADDLKDAESILKKAGTSSTESLRVGVLAPAPKPASTLPGTNWRHRGSDGANLSFSFMEGGSVSANMTGSVRDGTYSEKDGKVTIALAAKGVRPAIDIVLMTDGDSMKAIKYEVGGKPSSNNGRVFTKE